MPQRAVSLATVTALSGSVTPGKTYHSHQAGIRPKPRARVAEGPFVGLGRAKDPGHLPAEGVRANGKVHIIHAVVSDPYSPGRKQKVGKNAHDDALEMELKYKRITVDQYDAGKTYRGMLELSHGMPKNSAGEYLQPIGGNKVNGQARRMIALLEQGENCRLFFTRTQALVGQTGARILQLVLIGAGAADAGALSFANTAACMGMVARHAGETDASFDARKRREGEKVGWAFRDALKILANDWQFGTGRLPSVPEPRKWGK